MIRQNDIIVAYPTTNNYHNLQQSNINEADEWPFVVQTGLVNNQVHTTVRQMTLNVRTELQIGRDVRD